MLTPERREEIKTRLMTWCNTSVTRLYALKSQAEKSGQEGERAKIAMTHMGITFEELVAYDKQTRRISL